MKERAIRVQFVVPDLQVGGAERHSTTLLSRMDQDRFRSSVVCIGEEGEFFGALPAAKVEARALHLCGKMNAVRALRELVSITRRAQPDVVVMWGYNAETLGRIAARIGGVRHTIVWVHHIGGVGPTNRIRTAIDRALIPWTSAYFGVAEAQRRYLVDELGYPEHKIRIINNGVDPALFDVNTERGVLAEFGFTDGDPVVAMVAALHPWKDHTTFLRAARIVINEMPRAKFLVIGDGATRTELMSLCSTMRITPNVHFTGSRHDVGRLLCAIDVFVLSSHSEAFPISVLEAMACARPAVCTDVGGVREIVSHGKTGYLVPQNDPQQLAARLLTLLSNPQTAHRMGRAGRDRVEAEFSLERTIAAAEQAIGAVVSGHGVPRESANE
jgi:glycosyltransferase involved in cell wall biosynthesis